MVTKYPIEQKLNMMAEAKLPIAVGCPATERCVELNMVNQRWLISKMPRFTKLQILEIEPGNKESF